MSMFEDVMVALALLGAWGTWLAFVISRIRTP